MCRSVPQFFMSQKAGRTVLQFISVSGPSIVEQSQSLTVFAGFTAFTTIGYGDFAPKTPAGRSIFVVWALFGVATMTILISGSSSVMSTA